MSKLRAFRGFHYNPDQISEISRVVAPPYDVIDDAKFQSLMKASPYNVAAIDLPKASHSGDEAYDVAGKRYQEWKDSGILTQDDKESLYLYFQTYQLPGGEEVTRRGFFARRRLEDFTEGGVKPHERTFAGPKADRLLLMKATAANLSPIFGLFSDPEDTVGLQWDSLTQSDPLFAYSSEDGQSHRLWRLNDPEKIQNLLQGIQDQPIMIADGHHRYETALNYRDYRRQQLGEQATGEEPFNDVLMYCCSMQDAGLKVLPTHRVLAQRPDVAPEVVRQWLAKYAEVKEFSVSDLAQAQEYLSAEGKTEHAIAWVHDDLIEVWTFDPDKLLASESLNRLHFALRDLDVTLLHQLILEEILGVSQGAQREYGTIKYIKDAAEAVQLSTEKKTYGFLLNATKMEQMEAVTQIGATMPQKSTFFYPKVPTGLVFYDFSS